MIAFSLHEWMDGWLTMDACMDRCTGGYFASFACKHTINFNICRPQIPELSVAAILSQSYAETNHPTWICDTASGIRLIFFLVSS